MSSKDGPVDQSDPADRPLILLVEDRASKRASWSRGLKSLGGDVVTAKDSDQALAILRDSPAVDALLTDIHLAGGDSATDGVSLARFVKTSYDDSLPIIGYSGHFGAGELSEESLSFFDEAKLKGSLSAKQQRELRQDCVDRARRRRLERRSDTHSRRKEGAAGTVEVRNLILSEVDVDDLESMLLANGFEIRLLTSTAFGMLVRPVPVWVCRSRDEVTAQVYAQPLLHASGETEEHALDYLVELMVGLHEDLSEDAALAAAAPPFVRLFRYLEAVLQSEEVDDGPA